MEPEETEGTGAKETDEASEAGKLSVDEALAKRGRLRNYVVGLVVLLFMALIYAVTIVRLGGGAGHAP
ncbi:MAG TPA: hypothetical protein VK446_00185 [Methylocystis sp.]|nr:hypothetical protein [Methylocystis sp.]